MGSNLILVADLYSVCEKQMKANETAMAELKTSIESFQNAILEPLEEARREGLEELSEELSKRIERLSG